MLSLTALSSATGIASVDGLELPVAVAIRLLVYESNASRENDTIFPAWSFVMFHPDLQTTFNNHYVKGSLLFYLQLSQHQ